jgi:hypothetical protein
VLIVDEACGIGACFFFLNNDAIPAIAATPAKIGNNAPPVAATGANVAAVPPLSAAPVPKNPPVVAAMDAIVGAAFATGATLPPIT